jgi:hypothetical protein
MRALAATGAAVAPMEAGLEEAFIHLMTQTADNMR